MASKPHPDSKRTSSRRIRRAGSAAARLAVFTQLSERLTGNSHLDSALAKAFFKRAAEHLRPNFEPLLDRFLAAQRPGRDPNDVIQADILGDPTWGPPARAILVLWYTGGFRLPDQSWEMADAEQYYGALMWEAIGAHPPTLSNGYFGHWKYPAER
jgi:hypothetical protein